jgi:AAA domain, putative AbiEii toxin, Type IV TA system
VSWEAGGLVVSTSPAPSERYANHVTKPKIVPDEREKAWQRLLNTAIPFEIESIQIIESDIFAPQIIKLDRVIAVIGTHGTGKTLLLRMLEAIFGYITPAYAPPFIGSRPSQNELFEIKGIVEVELRTPRGLIRRRVDLEQPADTRRQIWTEAIDNSFEASYISPLYLFNELILLYQDFGGIRQRALSGNAQRTRSEKLKAINNIVRRDYSEVSTYPDIVDEYETGIVIPYISARIGSRTIDISMMSQGELWVHYVLNWFLEDGIENGSLALLDEPEAFLAVLAQRPFIDQIVRQAVSRSLQLIIATHSPEVLARLPLANIRMCITSDAGIQVIPPKSMFQIRESVGIQTPIRMLLLVEDELGKDILSLLFTRYDRALTREVEIVSAGGEGQVRNGLKIFQGVNKIACIGVLDGDKRDSVFPGEWPIFFLPGTSFPEDELVSAVSRQPAENAARIRVAPEDIMAAVSSCRGLDHQYWIKVIATHLGFTESVMTYELTQAWLMDRDIEAEAEKLVRTIRSYCP